MNNLEPTDPAQSQLMLQQFLLAMKANPELKDLLKTCLLSDEKDTPNNNNSPAKEKLPISRIDSNIGEASTPAFSVDPKKDIINKNDRKVVICKNNKNDQEKIADNVLENWSEQEITQKLENIVTENTTPDPKKKSRKSKSSSQEKQDQKIPHKNKIDEIEKNTKENDVTSTIEDAKFYSAVSHQNDSKDKIIEVAAEVEVKIVDKEENMLKSTSTSTPQGGSIFDLEEDKENQRPQDMKARVSIFESKKKSGSNSDKKSIKISESTHSLVANNNAVLAAQDINTTACLIDHLGLSLKLKINNPNLKLPTHAKYYIIKSANEVNIHRAIKYNMWCSTYHGNTRLSSGVMETMKKYGPTGEVYLFFSVNGSGHFCGIARIRGKFTRPHPLGNVWYKDEEFLEKECQTLCNLLKRGKKEKDLIVKFSEGAFDIDWVYIKDIPNSEFAHLKVVNNNKKPFSNSKDTTEIQSEVAKEAFKIFHYYSHKTSLIDDYEHYDKLEFEQNQAKEATFKKFKLNVR